MAQLQLTLKLSCCILHLTSAQISRPRPIQSFSAIGISPYDPWPPRTCAMWSRPFTFFLGILETSGTVSGERVCPTASSIDIPLGYIAMGVRLLGESDGCDHGSGEECPIRHVDKKVRGCYMESTTRMTSAPPIISRISRESRMAAFQAGRLLWNEHRGRGDGPDIGPLVDQQWSIRSATPSTSSPRTMCFQTGGGGWRESRCVFYTRELGVREFGPRSNMTTCCIGPRGQCIVREHGSTRGPGRDSGLPQGHMYPHRRGCRCSVGIVW